MDNAIDFWQARKDFLADLNYTRGYSPVPAIVTTRTSVSGVSG